MQDTTFSPDEISRIIEKLRVTLHFVRKSSIF